MQRNLLQLSHWQPHELQRGCCCGSLYGEVCWSACSEFSSPFFSSLPEQTDAKIRRL